MPMNEQERAGAAETLSADILGLLDRHLGNEDEGDLLSVGMTACISVAVALSSARAHDSRAAVALVRCLAETVAADIYGDAA